MHTVQLDLTMRCSVRREGTARSPPCNPRRLWAPKACDRRPRLSRGREGWKQGKGGMEAGEGEGEGELVGGGGAAAEGEGQGQQR